MKKQVWCKGAGRGANDRGGCTFCGFTGKPTKYWVVRPHLDRRWVNGMPPFSTTKPDDEIDDQRHRHLMPDALCEWCGEVDLVGRHENGCRLGLGPDELDSVNYRCPKCQRDARWTSGRAVSAGDERNEFWCKTCGAETPLEDCEVIPR